MLHPKPTANLVSTGQPAQIHKAQGCNPALPLSLKRFPFVVLMADDDDDDDDDDAFSSRAAS